jgi:hypothetical protein
MLKMIVASCGFKGTIHWHMEGVIIYSPPPYLGFYVELRLNLFTFVSYKANTIKKKLDPIWARTIDLWLVSRARYLHRHRVRAASGSASYLTTLLSWVCSLPRQANVSLWLKYHLYDKNEWHNRVQRLNFTQICTNKCFKGYNKKVKGFWIAWIFATSREISRDITRTDRFEMQSRNANQNRKKKKMKHKVEMQIKIEK